MFTSFSMCYDENNKKEKKVDTLNRQLHWWFKQISNAYNSNKDITFRFIKSQINIRWRQANIHTQRWKTLKEPNTISYDVMMQEVKNQNILPIECIHPFSSPSSPCHPISFIHTVCHNFSPIPPCEDVVLCSILVRMINFLNKFKSIYIVLRKWKV